MHDVIADWILSLDNLNFDIVNVFRLTRLRTVAIRVESVLFSKRNLLMFILWQLLQLLQIYLTHLLCVRWWATIICHNIRVLVTRYELPLNSSIEVCGFHLDDVFVVALRQDGNLHVETIKRLVLAKFSSFALLDFQNFDSDLLFRLQIDCKFNSKDQQHVRISVKKDKYDYLTYALAIPTNQKMNKKVKGVNGWDGMAPVK